MSGGLICYATKCTEGTIGEFWLALALSVVFVAVVALIGYFLFREK